MMKRAYSNFSSSFCSGRIFSGYGLLITTLWQRNASTAGGGINLIFSTAFLLKQHSRAGFSSWNAQCGTQKQQKVNTNGLFSGVNVLPN
jgi:hypothetical protein